MKRTPEERALTMRLAKLHKREQLKKEARHRFYSEVDIRNGYTKK